MTVLITAFPSGHKAGPGLPLQIQTSVFGPFPTGTQWQIQLFEPAPSENIWWTETVLDQFGSILLRLLSNPNVSPPEFVYTPAAGDTIPITATYTEPEGTVDSGTTSFTWDPTTGLPFQAIAIAQTQHGGLTGAEQEQLNAIYDNGVTTMNGIQTSIDGVGGPIVQTIGQIFSGKGFDTMTEGDLGSACHPDVLSATVPIGGSAYGLQTEALSWPDWYAFTGPAGDYSQQVLYTLSLARSGRVVLWQGVHTTSHLVYPMPGIPNIGIGVVNMPIDPGEYTVTITPSTGVCVGAQLLGFP